MFAWGSKKEPESKKMAPGLKHEIVVVPKWEENRDSGKTFLITEMPAMQAEKWGYAMLFVLKGSGTEIPEAVMKMGMIGVAYATANAFMKADIDPKKFNPLLDEMMTCVKLIRDPSTRDKVTGEMIATPIVSDTDIQEIQTLGWLRSEVIRVHTGFTLVEVIQNWLASTKTQPA